MLCIWVPTEPPSSLACTRAAGAILVFVSALLWSGCEPAAPRATVFRPELPGPDDLCQLLDRTIDAAYLHRRMNLRDHAAWQIVHGILAYERDLMIEDHQGKLVSALDYLLDGGEMRGWMLRPSDKVDPLTGRRGVIAVLDAGSTIGQGHSDQWIGYFADCNLPIEQTIIVGGQEFAIADLVRQAELDVPFNELREYSWTVMALSTYRPSNHEWTAADGSSWSMGKLLEIELNHELEGSACGGTHRLCGIALALLRHKDQNRPLEGPWLAADKKIRECYALAREFQNADGSFSTNFFTQPGSSLEIKTSLHATGHTFEFLALVADDEQIHEEWLRRAAVNLCEVFDATSNVALECGALYHGIRGLILYRQRLFGDRSFPRAQLEIVE